MRTDYRLSPDRKGQNMAETNGTPPPTPFEKFTDLTRRLMAVPKKDIDKAEAAYQRKKKRKHLRKKRKPA